MLIEHISVSRRDCYIECPARYKFRYHLNLPRDEGIEEPFYFVYGKIVHKIAEEYVSRKGKYNLNEIAQLVLSGEIEVDPGVKAPILPTEYKRKFPEHLRSIKKLNDKLGSDGLVEYHFKYDLDPPNQKCIKGFIDRIIISGDKYFIIDYKTTKKGGYRKNNATIKTDTQLRVYANVVMRHFGAKPENIHAALYYVDGGDFLGAKYTKEQLEETQKDLLEYYNRIADQNPDTVLPIVGNHCKRCDYRKTCPFLRST